MALVVVHSLANFQISFRPTEVVTVGAIQVFTLYMLVVHFVEGILFRIRLKPVYLALLMTLGTNFVHRTLEFISQLTL